jgi:hypothetical protein
MQLELQKSNLPIAAGLLLVTGLACFIIFVLPIIFSRMLQPTQPAPVTVLSGPGPSVMVPKVAERLPKAQLPPPELMSGLRVSCSDIGDSSCASDDSYKKTPTFQ